MHPVVGVDSESTIQCANGIRLRNQVQELDGCGIQAIGRDNVAGERRAGAGIVHHDGDAEEVAVLERWVGNGAGAIGPGFLSDAKASTNCS